MKKPLYLLAIPALLALAACRPGAAEYTEAESPKVLRVDGRNMVSLPPCPNWSQYPASDFTNMKTSNYGCATATNLGLMVANPADLVAGRDLARADATPAVSSVTRYLTDKVKLPMPTPNCGIGAGLDDRRIRRAAPAPHRHPMIQGGGPSAPTGRRPARGRRRAALSKPQDSAIERTVPSLAGRSRLP